MSIDRFTEVSSQGWFSRIGGSIKGILVGIVLCLAVVSLVVIAVAWIFYRPLLGILLLAVVVGLVVLLLKKRSAAKAVVAAA